jgi:hypothetical protein
MSRRNKIYETAEIVTYTFILNILIQFASRSSLVTNGFLRFLYTLMIKNDFHSQSLLFSLYVFGVSSNSEFQFFIKTTVRYKELLDKIMVLFY